MCLALLNSKPEDPEEIIDFMINWLANEKESNFGGKQPAKQEERKEPEEQIEPEEKSKVILRNEYTIQFPPEREGESNVFRHPKCE